MGKREPSYTIGGNVNWYHHYGEQYRGSLNTKVAIWSNNITPGYVSGVKNNLKRHMHPNVHCSSRYNSQDIEAT